MITLKTTTSETSVTTQIDQFTVVEGILVSVGIIVFIGVLVLILIVTTLICYLISRKKIQNTNNNRSNVLELYRISENSAYNLRSNQNYTEVCQTDLISPMLLSSEPYYDYIPHHHQKNKGPGSDKQTSNLSDMEPSGNHDDIIVVSDDGYEN